MPVVPEAPHSRAAPTCHSQFKRSTTSLPPKTGRPPGGVRRPNPVRPSTLLSCPPWAKLLLSSLSNPPVSDLVSLLSLYHGTPVTLSLYPCNPVSL
jgi:hypothetical protein